MVQGAEVVEVTKATLAELVSGSDLTDPTQCSVEKVSSLVDVLEELMWSHPMFWDLAEFICDFWGGEGGVRWTQLREELLPILLRHVGVLLQVCGYHRNSGILWQAFIAMHVSLRRIQDAVNILLSCCQLPLCDKAPLIAAKAHLMRRMSYSDSETNKKLAECDALLFSAVGSLAVESHMSLANAVFSDLLCQLHIYPPIMCYCTMVGKAQATEDFQVPAPEKLVPIMEKCFARAGPNQTISKWREWMGKQVALENISYSSMGTLCVLSSAWERAFHQSHRDMATAKSSALAICHTYAETCRRNGLPQSAEAVLHKVSLLDPVTEVQSVRDTFNDSLNQLNGNSPKVVHTKCRLVTAYACFEASLRQFKKASEIYEEAASSEVATLPQFWKAFTQFSTSRGKDTNARRTLWRGVCAMREHKLAHQLWLELLDFERKRGLSAITLSGLQSLVCDQLVSQGFVTSKSDVYGIAETEPRVAAPTNCPVYNLSHSSTLSPPAPMQDPRTRPHPPLHASSPSGTHDGLCDQDDYDTAPSEALVASTLRALCQEQDMLEKSLHGGRSSLLAKQKDELETIVCDTEAKSAGDRHKREVELYDYGVVEKMMDLVGKQQTTLQGLGLTEFFPSSNPVEIAQQAKELCYRWSQARSTKP